MRIVVVAALFLASAALGVLGCAAKGTSITAEEIRAAEVSGNLPALYRRVEAELAAEGDRPAPSTLAVKAQIGALLADQRVTELDAGLEEARLPIEGLIPLTALDTARKQAEPIQEWDAKRYGEFTARLGELEQAARDAIEVRRSEIGQLDADDYPGRLARVVQVIALVGEGSEQAAPWEKRRDELLVSLDSSVSAAIEGQEYDDAKRMLEMARQIDPENAQLSGQLATVDSKLFERRFWKALEDGDPDGAYTMLRDQSDAENFAEIRAKLADSAGPMADYFVELAAAQTAAGNLPDAYRYFSQARGIRKLLGAPQHGTLPAESTFIETVKKQYWEARKGNQPGLAWAYLSVIDDLEPSSPSHRRLMRETREAVLAVAVHSLAALPFQNSSTGPEFGEAVAAKIIQHLFEEIPEDIRIIEREQLADVLRERELKEGDERLASVDYIVQGDILEAKVDSTERQGRKTMRVVTGTTTETNPSYLRWINLSEKERKKTPEPPREVSVDKKEDISVNVTVQRKVGLFSVSYRVVDTESAKVIYADSLLEKAEHEDTSTEGVELGEFKQPFKLASLPSDLEILAELADEVSAEISRRLAKVLANPEDRYRAAGERYVDEGNFARASEQFAYSYVLAERKGKDVDEIGRRLRDTAVRTIERPRG
jgi:hypothetical protein